jgi:uncharacterized phiE125 gp8 family phage protein
MFVHRTPGVFALPFDMDALKLHVRDPEDQNLSLEACGLTAADEVEHFAQVALLDQTVRVTIYDPCQERGLHLPIGPVREGAPVSVTVDADAFSGFDLVAGRQPYLRWHSDFFDLNPSVLGIEYPAGFGARYTDIPRDLRQAILDQAALHYDGRSPMDAKALTTSPHMARIAARYRGVRT